MTILRGEISGIKKPRKKVETIVQGGGNRTFTDADKVLLKNIEYAKHGYSTLVKNGSKSCASGLNLQIAIWAKNQPVRAKYASVRQNKTCWGAKWDGWGKGFMLIGTTTNRAERGLWYI